MDIVRSLSICYSTPASATSDLHARCPRAVGPRARACESDIARAGVL